MATDPAPRLRAGPRLWAGLDDGSEFLEGPAREIAD